MAPATKAQATTKKFQKGERTVPAAGDKAQKYYSAEPDRQKKTVRKSIRAWKPRKSLQPGSVVIILAGRFRGKRVILLKNLDQGIILVTGPFKANGVPLRRVNARYVIATNTRVNLSGLDESVIAKASDKKYFARDRKAEKAGEEAFFKQGETAPAKKELSSERAADQKTIDKAILANVKKTPLLLSYLRSTWSLRSGQRPHEMTF